MAAPPTRDSAALHGILRLGVAGCYIGHGIFGFLAKPQWVPLFGFVGIPPATAYRLMPWVGAVDVTLGLLALFFPLRVVFLHLVVWGLWTAALRPLTGQPVWEMLERAGNYGVPLAALIGTAGASWVRAPGTRPARAPGAAWVLVLRGTACLLLVGHGMLAIAGSDVVRHRHEAMGLGRLAGVDSVVLSGVVDLALGVAVVVARRPGVFLAGFAWKLASELPVPLSRDSWLEFVERAGSYAALLALYAWARGRSALERLRAGAGAGVEKTASAAGADFVDSRP